MYLNFKLLKHFHSNFFSLLIFDTSKNDNDAIKNTSYVNSNIKGIFLKSFLFLRSKNGVHFK